MHTTQQLRSIVPAVCDLVDRIDPMQLNDDVGGGATVHDVLDEIIVRYTAHAHAFRGADAGTAAAPPVYGRVPASELRSALEALVAAAETPSATTRTVTTPVGDLDDETFGRLVAFDLLVMARDLAWATGLEFPVATLMADFDELTRTALTSRTRSRGPDRVLAGTSGDA